MLEENKTNNNADFQKLLDKDDTKILQVGDIVKGTVLAASKSEVKLDIDGIMTGVVRGDELYFEAEEYANLKPGDEVEATVIEEENENGELELSFRHAGQQKAWSNLISAFTNKEILKVKVSDVNKGGLLIKHGQIEGFLPVSQLAPENYPRVNGGDRGKILEKLKSFIGSEFEVRVMTLDEREEKFIVSEKEAWQEKQKDIISKYKVGSQVLARVTALTDFGVFVSFGENLEGLIHISELAWQRIDDPSDLFKVGDKIKAEIISLDGSKIFLSAKKLMADPWKDVDKKYKVGQNVSGTILKVNPFGLFVELDKDIHGLAHLSQLWLAPGQRIGELFKVGDKNMFAIVSIEPKDHRLGLAPVNLVRNKFLDGVKNSSEALNPAEIIQKSNHIAEKRNNISNGVKEAMPTTIGKLKQAAEDEKVKVEKNMCDLISGKNKSRTLLQNVKQQRENSPDTQEIKQVVQDKKKEKLVKNDKKKKAATKAKSTKKR